jgi:16S rRNA (adenine1518-N6/adenine1519-N6)-dimethyltransferase
MRSNAQRLKSKIQAAKTKTAKPKAVFAKKSLGQNFLVDQNVIDKIITAIDPQVGETIFEIGPGRGALTKKLIETGANVVAIELDRVFVPNLRADFAAFPNFKIIEADALDVDFRALLKTENLELKTKLVANLPYNISTAILQRLAEQRECFSKLVLMLQREVVERIAAKPGDSDRGFLTILVERYFSSKKLFDVPGSAFRPIPNVWSSVVELLVKEELLPIDEKLLRQLLVLAFAQKRKTILNNLKQKYENAGEILDSCRIATDRRSETLTLIEWINLTNQIQRTEPKTNST